MFARDYLNLRENPHVRKILQANKEDPEDQLCFSDQMMRINKKEHKEKRVLFVTRIFQIFVRGVLYHRLSMVN